MPYLKLVTNVASTGVAKTFASQAVKSMSRLLGKPENVFFVHINGNQQIQCGGDGETPCVWGDLTSIGVLGPHINYTVGKELIDLISKNFSVPKERITINFHAVQKHEICKWEFLNQQ